MPPTLALMRPLIILNSISHYFFCGMNPERIRLFCHKCCSSYYSPKRSSQPRLRISVRFSKKERSCTLSRSEFTIHQSWQLVKFNTKTNSTQKQKQIPTQKQNKNKTKIYNIQYQLPFNQTLYNLTII